MIKAKDSDKDKEKGNGKDKRKDKGKGKGKGKDKDLKMSSEDVLSKFEEHKIQDPLRFLSLHNHGFPGGLIILESNKYIFLYLNSKFLVRNKRSCFRLQLKYWSNKEKRYYLIKTIAK